VQGNADPVQPRVFSLCTTSSTERQLLGHRDVATTMVSTHVLRQTGSGSIMVIGRRTRWRWIGGVARNAILTIALPVSLSSNYCW
jgi:hypothetical protein